MRLLLSWGGDEREMAKLISSLKQAGHGVVYWIEMKKSYGKFPGIIIHDHFDAWINTPPPEMAGVKFDPPSEELIKKLSGVESIILTMMNKHFEGWSVDQRKTLYYDALAYWYGVLNRFQPEAVVFSIAPHPVHNYLLFELARLLKIKTFIFDTIAIADRVIWFNDIWQGSTALIEEIKKNRGKNFSLNDLCDDFRIYLKYQDEAADPTPSYTKADLRKNLLKNKIALKSKILFKSLKNLTLGKKFFLYVKKLLVDNLQKEYYRFCASSIDSSQKFIYAPLHYQPECNTSPMGGVFVNQILMLKILSAALPSGWAIYVKEHPAQWITFGLNYTDYRYHGYYRQIAEIKNVRLVHHKTNHYALVKNSQAVATVTGTAGWEAILRGKPALIFGQAWYKDCEGVFKVSSAETCRSAIEKIASGYAPSRQSLINYLKCLEASSIRGYSEEWAEKNLKKLTKEEYFDNILTLLNKELSKL